MATAEQRHDSVSAAVDALTAAGYDDDLACEPLGLRSARSGRLFPVDELVVDHEERFEGATDPADQQLVLALGLRGGGPLGTVVVAYGPTADECQAKVLRRLARARDEPRRS